ncbi:GTPase Era [Buchnera aphidicola (Eriosoma lanigerum)]|uniref:GTPase Era n=1 Tax=Buchnera aphidicola TaxID=9 RepID=UPI003464AFD0
MKHNNNNKFCGKIVLLGKSNVGKSTLLNQIIGDKISIVSHKTNTTQTQVIGIQTENNFQLIYIDTPGIYNKKNIYFSINNINQYIKKTIANANVIVFMINQIHFNITDEKILQLITKINKSIIVVINKIDLINNKKLLLPFIQLLHKKNNNLNCIIPISAKKKHNITNLIKEIKTLLPQSRHEYSNNINTTNSLNFTITEIIREKIIYYFHKEIPYIIDIKVESINISSNRNCSIKVLLMVNNYRQKKIIIGEKGEKIKHISTLARKNIEKKILKTVFITIWVITKKK